MLRSHSLNCGDLIKTTYGFTSDGIKYDCGTVGVIVSKDDKIRKISGIQHLQSFFVMLPDGKIIRMFEEDMVTIES